MIGKSFNPFYVMDKLECSRNMLAILDKLEAIEEKLERIEQFQT